MISALFGDLIPYIVAALAALAGLWGYGRVKRREGVKDERASRAAQDAKALQRGAEGAAEGKAKLNNGKTPQEVKHENDRKWR